MTTIQDAYINALLADATYALTENKDTGYSGNDLKGLDTIKIRMTTTLANFIGNNFEVATHIDTSDNILIGSYNNRGQTTINSVYITCFLTFFLL